MILEVRRGEAEHMKAYEGDGMKKIESGEKGGAAVEFYGRRC